jgi:ubiquinone biosynthesis accessory factor UbiJ
MNTTSNSPLPFKFPPNLQDLPSWLQPPQWLVQELQQKVVLLLNHVLQQEPEAMARISRQKGKVVHVDIAQIAIKIVATPAGLLDLAAPDTKADLMVTVTQTNPVSLVQTVLRGEKPAIHIAGDVLLAAEVNWLVDHVRWDMEEDLSRMIGDAPAHTVAQLVGQATQMLRRFVPTAPQASSAASAASAASN